MSCNCTLQRASRLRETHVFKKLHSPTSVLSTRNLRFPNQVSSRLRETLLFLTNCRLVYAKHLLWEAKPSRAQPSRADPSKHPQHQRKVASCVRKTHIFKKLYSPTSVSSTRNTRFQNQVSSHLRETLLSLTYCLLVYAKRPLRHPRNKLAPEEQASTRRTS